MYSKVQVHAKASILLILILCLLIVIMVCMCIISYMSCVQAGIFVQQSHKLCILTHFLQLERKKAVDESYKSDAITIVVIVLVGFMAGSLAVRQKLTFKILYGQTTS